MWAWCNHCANDHSMHGSDPHGPGCEIMCEAMVDLPNGWPEAWLPEPDDGSFALPSRMICGAFRPCEDCGGDPGAEDRAERVAVVTAYWREHGAQPAAERGSSSLAAVLPPLVTALLLVLSVAYREQVRTLVWLTPLALLLLAVAVGCVWLAGRLTARPPMTEHLRPSDDERRLLERLR